MLERVKKIIENQLEINSEDIRLESSLKDDLGIDSLEIFEIVMEMEDEFNVEIPNEDLEDMETIQDVVDYLESKVE